VPVRASVRKWVSLTVHLVWHAQTGVAALAVADLKSGEKRDLWLDLAKTLTPPAEGAAGSSKKYGQLHLVAEYKELKDEMVDETEVGAGGEEAVERAPEGTPKGGGLLVVIVHSGQELETKHGVPTAYVKLKYRHHEVKTKVRTGGSAGDGGRA
jgi:hypothetical protein